MVPLGEQETSRGSFPRGTWGTFEEKEEDHDQEEGKISYVSRGKEAREAGGFKRHCEFVSAGIEHCA